MTTYKLNAIQAEADALLERMGHQLTAIKALENGMAEEIRAIQDRYKPDMAAIKSNLSENEADLKNLVKAEQAAILGTSDRVILPHGMVAFSMVPWVKRARGVLENIEKIGREDLLKITKVVNWDEMAKMPDAFLVSVGTERVTKDHLEWEATS